MEQPQIEEISFLRDVNTLFRLLTNYGARSCKESGVTIAQAQMLLYMAYHAEDSSLESIAKGLHMAKSAVRLTLHQLVQGHYLERIPDDHDRRVFHFVMLEKGRQLLPQFYQLMTELNREALSTLTDYERIVFLGLLGKVKQKTLETFLS